LLKKSKRKLHQIVVFISWGIAITRLPADILKHIISYNRLGTTVPQTHCFGPINSKITAIIFFDQTLDNCTQCTILAFFLELWCHCIVYVMVTDKNGIILMKKVA